MDNVNSDNLIDVPDTPNRFGVNGAGRKRLFMRPPRKIANSSTIGTGDSLPSRNGAPFKVSSIPNPKEKHSLHLAKSENMETKNQISPQQDRHVIDLTKLSGPSSASKGKEPANLSRVIGQKRLVRNGCISPLNIAKAKKAAGTEDSKVLTHGASGTTLTASGTSSDRANEPMFKDGISLVKGKGLLVDLVHSSPPQQHDRTHSLSSDSTRDGWVCTRNRSLNMNSSLPIVSGESSGPVEPTPGPQCRQINRHPTALNVSKKRLKPGPTSSSRGECSASAPNDSGVISLVSPESKINTRSARNPNHGVEPMIEVDIPSTSTRTEGSRGVRSSSRNEDARARQLEADERLARELQEQLYNETTASLSTAEIDEDVALALAREGTQLLSLNGASATNIPRRQSRNASNATRRVSQARASTSYRMARLRNRFPGQPRTLSSSRGRNSLFPPNMDVDTRMHILETLEAFSSMEVDGNLLQTQRDFNENDYEMLLALDENNHQHGGASVRQINNLPQSTVQTENLEESCAVCLETPTIGDVIRHLPCFHKFHKDCIDPWLSRKMSCPVCKCSIT